jgi:hypothetical protein
MKRYILLLVLFTFTISVYCQQITFQKYYVDSLDVFSNYFQVLQTNDHGYLTGNVRALVKTDSLGQIEWYRKYAYGNGSPLFFTSCKTYNNEYMTTGQSLILKLNANYTISWKKELIVQPSISYAFYAAEESSDHGFILAGELDFNQILTSHFFLIKTDSLGIIEWSKIYSLETGNDIFGSLLVTNDGGYILCGNSKTVFDTSSNHNDIKIIKTDSLGNPQWAKHYNRNIPDENFCYHITATYDGGYALIGNKNFDTFILKIDSTGNILWKKLYVDAAGGAWQSSRWIEETKDYGLVVTAFLDGSGTLFFKTDSAGNLLWTRNYPYIGPQGACVRETDDGGYIIGAVGYAGTNSSGNFFDAMCLIKTDSLGHTNGCYENTPAMTISNMIDSVINVAITDSNLNVTTVPSTLAPVDSGYEFVLCPPVVGVNEITKSNGELKIYPNPFYNQVEISGLNPKEVIKSSIGVYNLMGVKVFEQEHLSNKTKLELNLSFLQQGVYFLSVKANGVQYTRKIIKLQGFF